MFWHCLIYSSIIKNPASSLADSEVYFHLPVGKTLTGYKKGRPLPVLPIMGRPPSSAPQNQTSTSTWNSTSYT